MTYNTASSHRGAGSCIGSSSNFQFLGTAYSMTNPSPAFTSASGFSITIQNCLNDSAASCYNANPALQDPINNPQVQVSGSVFPPQQGNG
jgi:hypothetical protein